MYKKDMKRSDSDLKVFSVVYESVKVSELVSLEP